MNLIATSQAGSKLFQSVGVSLGISRCTRYEYDRMAEHKQEIDVFGAKDDFWLFGYGSLIWKPPPHYGTHCIFNNREELALVSGLRLRLKLV